MEFRDLLERRVNGTVGDPKDVHYIISPCHHIGFATHTNQDGRVVCEIIEGLRVRLEVLRVNGRVVAIQPCMILRHESNGHMHIV